MEAYGDLVVYDSWSLHSLSNGQKSPSSTANFRRYIFPWIVDGPDAQRQRQPSKFRLLGEGSKCPNTFGQSSSHSSSHSSSIQHNSTTCYKFYVSSIIRGLGRCSFSPDPLADTESHVRLREPQNFVHSCCDGHVVGSRLRCWDGFRPNILGQLGYQ